MLSCVNGAIFVIQRYENVLHNEIVKYSYVQGGYVLSPTTYIVNNVSKVTLENRVDVWYFSMLQYMQYAVTNVEQYMR